jgi:hypothetical protein
MIRSLAHHIQRHGKSLLLQSLLSIGISLVACAFGSPLLAAQPASGDRGAQSALVTFTLDFPESTPSHYSIAVESTGHASYESTVKVENSADQTYRTEFELSPASREHIFEWTKQAHYFSGKVDAGRHNLAFTGAKILSYQDGQRSFTAQYNYSSLEPVRQLTVLFQNMAGTLEYGRELAYYHRYQKLALDDELKRMEAQARNNELSEIQGIAPVLQEIADDSSVINGVRARARALIQMGKDTIAGR